MDEKSKAEVFLDMYGGYGCPRFLLTAHSVLAIEVVDVLFML